MQANLYIYIKNKKKTATKKQEQNIIKNYQNFHIVSKIKKKSQSLKKLKKIWFDKRAKLVFF